MKRILLSPSVMCADLLNLEKSIKEMEILGVDNLHVDIIDGQFSPSMPLGIDTVKQLRQITDMPFDVHIMAMNNQFYIDQMLEIGVERIAFHIESTLHIDRTINYIKNHGVKVGLAITPATPLSVLKYVLSKVDYITLMLINPGFATDKGEKQASYALEKISDLRNMVDEQGLNTLIQVDGRVSLETIENLVAAGADDLVLGSTSLFRRENTPIKNKQLIEERIVNGLKKRNGGK